MKVAFLLDDDDPQDSRKLKELAYNTDMMIALWDIDKMFRNALKYEGYMKPKEYLNDEETEVVEKLRQDYFDILEEYNLTKLILEMP
jgi:hypothetical protein